MKNIQIKQELFIKLIQYFTAKKSGMTMRNYSIWSMKSNLSCRRSWIRFQCGVTTPHTKTAPTEQEREEARKKYLEERGVPENFRW